MSGSDPLAESARIAPETAALMWPAEDVAHTHRELDAWVDRLAGGFAARGLEPGDRVVIYGGIDPAVYAVIHACWRRGVVPVPMDPEPASDRRRRRETMVNPSTIVAAEGAEEAPAAAVSIEELGGDSEAGTDVTDSTSLAAILFTSGTTGDPQAIPLSWENVRTNAVASAFRLGLSRTDRWGVCLAPYHMGGFAPLVRASLYATGLVVHEPTPVGTAEAITERGITGISLVPTMLRRALAEGVPLDELRVVLVGGDRTPPSLVKRALEADVPVCCSYGMTEASSQIATATPADLQDDPETVGTPLRWTQVNIRSRSGEPCEPGETGEIVVSGPSIVDAHLDDGGPNRFTEEGALRTGDRGHLDDRGRLFVTGRLDYRIVTGGATVDPRAVEAVLRDHPAVVEAAVIGLPDETWGERVGALLVTAAGRSGEDIVAEVSAALADAERPRAVRLVDEMPRTPSGTVDRSAVRELLDAGGGS